MKILLDAIINSTTEYIEKMPKSQRKKYGQFFTSKETARFMASLFNIPCNKEELTILDAGAGSGILSAAIIERLQSIPQVKRIQLVCYESDPNILQLLQQNLLWICSNSSCEVFFEICTDNYILSQMLDYNEAIGANPNPRKFDIVIGNPPYMKLSKSAVEALAMPDVCFGAPNLYFLFAAMGMFNLKSDGEMVYITPRSWTSGAYFKKFRQEFLSKCVIEHIHLFASRDKVFESEDVLQETMIFKVKKTTQKPHKITITTTNSNRDFSEKTEFTSSYDTIVSGQESYVFLVTNEEEALILKQLHQWKDTLPSIGLKMKTGLTVDFRNKDALRSAADTSTVPLFYSHHIQEGKVVFPIGKENEYIATSQAGLLQENKNYLFIKRFTAKEEHRRLQCGVYLARKHPEYAEISTQNKINFIDGLRSLSECIVYGLYVIFNSILYDRYYRILNGSTQVNSTEINTLPVPPLAIIEEMGKKLICTHDMSESACDQILRSYL